MEVVLKGRLDVVYNTIAHQTVVSLDEKCVLFP